MGKTLIFYSSAFNEQFVVESGDVLVGMDGDFTPCVWQKGKALLNQRVGRILPLKGHSQRFLYYFLTAQLKAIEEATARTTVKHLSHSDVEKIHEPLPPLPEQQKIAECLSSVDDLIAAQARKLDALKTHKKGLMQQLFPREGETQPRLRFPEFRDAEGWEEKRLGNEGEFFSSLTGKAGDDFDAGEARFVTYINVFTNTFVDPSALRFVDVKEGENQNAVASGDVFFTISSETPEEVGMSSVLMEDLENCYLNSFCALFRFSESKRPNPVFTGFLLRQPLVRRYFTKKAQGSTRFNLSKDAFRNLPLFVPSPPEQQKIADCLSSVDELIAAQMQKLAALKTHKKGLMQQLFPSAQAVEA